MATQSNTPTSDTMSIVAVAWSLLALAVVALAIFAPETANGLAQRVRPASGGGEVLALIQRRQCVVAQANAQGPLLYRCDLPAQQYISAQELAKEAASAESLAR